MPDRLKFLVVAILSVLLFANVVANILRGRTVIGWTEFILLGLILLVGVGGLLSQPAAGEEEDEEN